MRIPALLVIVSLALATTGCAVMTANGRTLHVGSEHYSAYVEHVFREQNRVASKLAFALIDAQDAAGQRYDQLTHAEDGLFNGCEALNDLAARRRDGRRIGPIRGLRAARSAPACERAALAAEAALNATTKEASAVPSR